MADWGPERLREVVEAEYLGFRLPDGPPPGPSPDSGRDHVGVHPQVDGLFYVGFAPRAGRIPGHQLRRVAELADRFGGGRVRTTTQQKLAILDVPGDQVGDLVAALEEEDLRVQASSFRRGTMACTGIEFCKLAIGETKARAQWLYQELEERLPDFDEEIRPVEQAVWHCRTCDRRFELRLLGLGAPGGVESDQGGAR